MTYTYKEISKITGKKVENIRSLAFKLGIKRTIFRGSTRITQDGLELLQAHYAPKISKINDRRKIRVIESYFNSESYREISKTCKMAKGTVKKIVEEWKETGCIVVDSFINFPEKIQNKGIFYRNYNWGYSFTFNKNRYYKRGFTSELEANEALNQLKEQLRNG